MIPLRAKQTYWRLSSDPSKLQRDCTLRAFI